MLVFEARSQQPARPPPLAGSLLFQFRFSMQLLMPCTMEMTAIRNITPMQTPRSVKKLFSFCTRICARASQTASMNGSCYPFRIAERSGGAMPADLMNVARLSSLAICPS